MEGHALGRHGDPATQVIVVREEVEHGPVRRPDVLGITAERDPAERAFALAEKRSDVRRDEAGELEGSTEPAQARFVADRVAVVEDLGALIHEADHRLNVLSHGEASPVGEFLGLLGGIVRGVLEVDAVGEIAQRIMRTGLVGDDVDLDTASQQFGEDDRGIPDDADAQCTTLVLGRGHPLNRVVKVVRDLIEVAVLHALGQSSRIDINEQADALIHRDGERLGATHATATGGQRERARESAAELARRHGSERLVGALQDALGADIDP